MNLAEWLPGDIIIGTILLLVVIVGVHAIVYYFARDPEDG